MSEKYKQFRIKDARAFGAGRTGQSRKEFNSKA